LWQAGCTKSGEASRYGNPDTRGKSCARRRSFDAGPRNGTLLIDLLTEDEEALDRYTTELRFDIDYLIRRQRPERHLEIIPGATHWFEQSGTLDKVADLARQVDEK
jgi:hypothetical protein